MQTLILGLLACLGFGLVGATVAWILGGTVLTIAEAIFGPGDDIGQRMLMLVVALPGGFALGALAAAVLLWRSPGQTDADAP